MTDLPRAFGPLLGHCAHLVHERMHARLADCGQTPAQTHVMLYLQCHGGQAEQREITSFLRVRPSTANGILDRMEENGLIRRSVSAGDARRRLITLTDQGARWHEQLHRVFLDMETLITRGFTDEETVTLSRLLERVRENLEEDRRYR